MLAAWPVRPTVTRRRPPYCISAYTVSLSLGSAAHWKPSAPRMRVQSATPTPALFRVRLGPPQLPLSWRPPYTLYGLRMSAVTP